MPDGGTIPAWMRNLVNKVRTADSDAAAAAAVKDYIDPESGEALHRDPADGDTHVHVHLGEKEGGTMPRGRDDGDPEDLSGGDDITELKARVAQLEEVVEQLMDGDEQEVELEGENEDGTRDARRFTMRRGKKMRARDELDVPERTPEMMGETDLPGIEDLDKRMPTATAADRKKARDSRVHKVRDAAYAEGTWDEMVAGAEILVPGMKFPVFDAMWTPANAASYLCGNRKRILDRAYKDEAVRAVISPAIGIPTFDGLRGLPCDTVKIAFNAAVQAMRTHNNAGNVRREAGKTGDSGTEAKGPPTPAQMNQQNRDFWARRKAESGHGR